MATQIGPLSAVVSGAPSLPAALPAARVSSAALSPSDSLGAAPPALSTGPGFTNPLPEPTVQLASTTISSRFMTELRDWMRRQRTWERAENELVNRLRGRTFQPGEIIAVQLDLMRPPGESLRHLWGKTFVFRVTETGLERRGAFDSTSQSMTLGTSPKSYPVTRERGPAYIRSGVYQVSRGLEDQFGGTFRFSPDRVPSYRDTDLGGVARDGSISAAEAAYWSARDEYATGILFHSAAYGSVGCQVISSRQHEDFIRAIQGGTGDTFTYVLVRDGEPGAIA